MSTFMSTIKPLARWTLGLLFVAAGLNHFRSFGFYKRIVPDYLPLHGPIVAVSGVAEVLLGGLLLVPRTARAAAWGLVALLLAVFPANVHMASHAGDFPQFPRWALWARLPLQGVLVAWAWWHTRARR